MWQHLSVDGIAQLIRPVLWPELTAHHVQVGHSRQMMSHRMLRMPSSVAISAHIAILAPVACMPLIAQAPVTACCHNGLVTCKACNAAEPAVVQLCLIEMSYVQMTNCTEEILLTSCSDNICHTRNPLSQGTATPDLLEVSIYSQPEHQMHHSSFGTGAHKLQAGCWHLTRGNSSVDTHHYTSWFAQFRLLYWRSMVISIRNPLDMGARVLASAVLGVLEGLVFLHLGYGRLPQGQSMRGR